MATLELDPLFYKGLRYLHSKSKDSALHLRSMIDDTIAGRKVTKTKTEGGEQEGSDIKKGKYEMSSKEDRKEKDKLHKKDKRELEKEKERQEKEKLKELEREKEKEKEQTLKNEIEDDSDEHTEEDDKSVNADDFAFGLGVCCYTCSKFGITPKNQLVECQECHNLYHQECHKPPVTGDVSDPRFVWYCSKCTKTIKKIAAQKPPKSKPTTQSSSSSKESSSSKSGKSEPLSTAQPFKRIECKFPTSSSSSKDPQNPSSTQPLRGLASLAANLTKGNSSKTDKAYLSGWKTEATKPITKESGEKSSRSESSKANKEAKGEKSGATAAAGSSSSSSGKGNSGANSGKQPSLSGNTMATANKRIQLMKKTAAKQQEKRVHVK